jgi:tRNA pseudouridine55 synthase
MQAPPAYSAVKVGGERLYAKARRGEFVQADERPVTVYRFELLKREGERAELEIECSSGTYVRQLVADLGDAYCEELERMAIGPFRLEDASEERLIPLEDALEFLPDRELDDDELRLVGNGVAVPDTRDPTPHTRLMHDGRLIAIAEPRDQKLKPILVFK